MRRFRILIATCITLALAGYPVWGGSPGLVSITPALPGPAAASPDPGMFLVARRALDGSHFGRSVIYLVEHDDSGTLGLIVNRSGDVSLSEVVPDIEEPGAAQHFLHYGGPVGLPVIFILMRAETGSEVMRHVADDIYAGFDRRALDEVLASKKPASEVRFYIGYSGWAAGQLDSELERGSWHVLAADADTIFSAESGTLWERLIETLEPGGIQVLNRPVMPQLKSFSETL